MFEIETYWNHKTSLANGSLSKKTTGFYIKTSRSQVNYIGQSYSTDAKSQGQTTSDQFNGIIQFMFNMFVTTPAGIRQAIYRTSITIYKNTYIYIYMYIFIEIHSNCIYVYCIYNYNHKNIIYIYICTCLPILKFLECMFVELVIDTAYVQHVHLEWWQQTLTNQNKLLSMSLVRAFVQPFREAPCQWGRKNSTCQCLCDKRTCQACQVRRERDRPWTGRLDSNCIPVFKPCFEYKIHVLTCMVDHKYGSKAWCVYMH